MTGIYQEEGCLMMRNKLLIVWVFLLGSVAANAFSDKDVFVANPYIEVKKHPNMLIGYKDKCFNSVPDQNCMSFLRSALTGKHINGHFTKYSDMLNGWAEYLKAQYSISLDYDADKRAYVRSPQLNQFKYCALEIFEANAGIDYFTYGDWPMTRRGWDFRDVFDEKRNLKPHMLKLFERWHMVARRLGYKCLTMLEADNQKQ